MTQHKGEIQMGQAPPQASAEAKFSYSAHFLLDCPVREVYKLKLGSRSIEKNGSAYFATSAFPSSASREPVFCFIVI
ncbi:MAG TPA: hypothetical protein DDY78_12380 [Planctomycetales bacterium]|nr:hypothetical protein [Planctomycetales bacterium]